MSCTVIVITPIRRSVSQFMATVNLGRESLVKPIIRLLLLVGIRFKTQSLWCGVFILANKDSKERRIQIYVILAFTAFLDFQFARYLDVLCCCKPWVHTQKRFVFQLFLPAFRSTVLDFASPSFVCFDVLAFIPALTYFKQALSWKNEQYRMPTVK